VGDATPAGAGRQLAVGRVGRAHGIHGLVTVEVRTDDPERRFAPGQVLHPASSDGGQGLEVRSARPHSGRLLVSFVGVDDRSSAEALRGTVLLVTVDESDGAGNEDPDEFYDHQLVGLSVRGPEGRDLGAVTDVVHLPGQELLVVSYEGREVLVPFVRAIVVAVDQAAGQVVVDPPDGLFSVDLHTGTSGHGRG
jgi:16S rRNA processing protein RimM